ncbi:response regulators consisting of a CheY-like receiver domain and a winged-helix DNA-binding domain [Coriobacteriaceae bacterium EMTCatB1]|nr:response regulators consisting of a CheY-like receiver domain and a winged-helix DNA-binding domain [Coriobacteriaceae bacterium EMTCatB1]
MTGKRILIADDNMQIRMLVKAALRQLDCEIVEAVDGEEALERAVAEPPDLLLLDVTMPKLDGFEVLEFLRKRPSTADIKVVMLTTAAQKTDLQRGVELGCDEYVVKPFEPRALRETVERVMGAGSTGA